MFAQSSISASIFFVQGRSARFIFHCKAFVLMRFVPILSCVILCLLIAPISSAHLDENGSSPGLADEIKSFQCSIQSSSKARLECYHDLCEPSYKCAESIMLAATQAGGPSSGMIVLRDVFDSRQYAIGSDGHELAHKIGRETASHFGINGEAFLSCGSDFNYGCQHGFFEYALGKTESSLDAATLICENLPKSLPQKDYFYCYHGVGHGVLMAQAYDMQGALDECDKLTSMNAQRACWQGMFMENVNGQMKREARKGVFDANDPLAPCSHLEEKYQYDCYENHAGYLISLMNLSLSKASAACLGAIQGKQGACMIGLGLMTTNPGWQHTMSKKNNFTMQNAYELCRQFPDGFLDDCIIAGAANLINFGQVSEASELCALGPEEDTDKCFKRIGSALRVQTSSPQMLAKKCEDVPLEFRQLCIGDGSIIPISADTRRIPASSAASPQNKELEMPNPIGRVQKIFSFLNPLLWNKAMHDFVRSKKEESKSKSEGTSVIVSAMDDGRILADDAYVRELMHKYTLTSITESLRRISEAQKLDCHSRAHKIGHIAYEELGSNAFKSCGIECHSGCVHGATEAFFAEKGTSNLDEELAILCAGQYSGFATHQCLHGIGHGLMAWSDYDLPAALDACNLLPSAVRPSCWSGAFMENIVGTFAEKRKGHYSNYLSNDPHFPCNAVNSTYQPTCYHLQTSRMIVLFHGDFARVAAECAKVTDQYGKMSCFLSMGRDVSGANRNDPKKIVEQCKKAGGEGMRYCFNGAVQDQFWDESQAQGALMLCTELEPFNMSDECYSILIARSGDILSTGKSKDKFCSQLPSKFLEQCKNTKPSTMILDSPEKTIPKNPGIKQKQEPAGAKTYTIIFQNDVFTPNNVNIRQGDSVTWVNSAEYDFWPASNIHPTHEIYPEFDPKKPIGPGKNWTFTFTKSGIHRFHDHLLETATGSVTVR
jgi:plastocyanin